MFFFFKLLSLGLSLINWFEKNSYSTFGSSATYVQNTEIVLGRRMSPGFPGFPFEYQSMVVHSPKLGVQEVEWRRRGDWGRVGEWRGGKRFLLALDMGKA